jgi:hypothetical protein
MRIITPSAVTMPPHGSSIRCLQLLRKPIHTSFASPARRFLQTQSRQDQDPPSQQNKEGWLLRKAAKVDQEMSDWQFKQEQESKRLQSQDDLTSEFEAEDFAVPDPLDQPGWILPIPELPRRHLVSKRSECSKICIY